MKPSVAITLIVCGTVVVAIPPLVTAWKAYVETLALTHGAMLASGEGDIGDLYRIGCWLLGAAMILVGIVSSLAPTAEPRFAPLAASLG